MNRRNFIKVTGLGAGMMLVASQLSGCDSASPEAYGWAPRPESLDDIRLKVLSYAILAPNPHNKQAWRVHFLDKRRLALYVDQDRLLPYTDPHHRQTHIGQGTFLEMLRIAATAFGYEAEIDYFPDGEYGNHRLEEVPIAVINLVPNPSLGVDPLFSTILERHSNKRAYRNEPLSQDETSALLASVQARAHSSLTIDSSPANCAHLRQFMVEAMAIEGRNDERNLETIAMFRFNDDEVQKYRDGFGVAQAGMTGIAKFAVESFFLNRTSAEKDPPSFGDRAVEMTREITDSTQSFGWLCTSGNTRLDQVKAGEDYSRFSLLATSMGLVQHPMSQVLEEYEDMLPLQRRFKSTLGIGEDHTVQMLVRLGKAKPCTHSPRRSVQAFISRA